MNFFSSATMDPSPGAQWSGPTGSALRAMTLSRIASQLEGRERRIEEEGYWKGVTDCASRKSQAQQEVHAWRRWRLSGAQWAQCRGEARLGLNIDLQLTEQSAQFK